MKINLNNPEEFTFEEVRKLVASQDDTEHTKFQVTTDGYLTLTTDVDNEEMQDLKFFLPQNVAGNDYVGKNASLDDEYVKSIFDIIRENWQNSSTGYIDDF
jgi:hypothetical protein